MKLLKKHLILLLVTGLFSLSSCSSDDGDTESNTVIGTWTLVEINPTAWDLEECPDKPLITFNDDDTADWVLYSQNNNCEGQTDEATWKKISATEYSITIPEQGTFEGTVTFESSQKFTFDTFYKLDASTSIPVRLTFQM
ncbi:lipocalin family protein [Salinimicrobium gaetbulicola]|uniref:Lipocalin family protein n=1 Tax=Salinimicrobium gaetbulicola TaxID=999702 RepID=A0ABW3IE66_9FLAO